MNSKNLFRFLAPLAVCMAVITVVIAPAFAQTAKPAAKTAKKSTVAVKLYECQHCKEPMTLAEAKKKGMKCCGLPMVEVKLAKKADTKKKS